MSDHDEFAREFYIVQLAAKLQLGTASPAEQLLAANLLSRIAGERLGLERRVRELEQRAEVKR